MSYPSGFHQRPRTEQAEVSAAPGRLRQSLAMVGIGNSAPAQQMLQTQVGRQQQKGARATGGRACAGHVQAPNTTQANPTRAQPHASPPQAGVSAQQSAAHGCAPLDVGPSPADPHTFVHRLLERGRKVLVQKATLDFIIPNEFTDKLVQVAKVPMRDYVAEHAFIVIPFEPAYIPGVIDLADFLAGEIEK